ncbi:NusG domain II-containing protein [Serpentinicella alkaliphila]|uniref:Uncharacterized protein n=1 Tax=Serpentinicella alkaliphila TaxID=1734049 RepID=A0A4R2TJ11_9FIRM|nr:NusG domain II-containing protein [Serpentinicella alkaliphila]QUH24953.1 NusG domain II-containing protein [Serpentinicella alkaliphila]TCQ02756.1 hypothetical protein EDD79_101337 [Serpentinicella alkaliphila]
MKVFTKADIALIAVIIILSTTSIFAIPRLLTSGAEIKEIVINIDGAEIHRFPLEYTEESKFIDFPFIINGEEYTGRLELLEGSVRLHRLSKNISPLSIHADMGWISESYQMIVSLPIKLYISIEESTEVQHDFDIIAY